MPDTERPVTPIQRYCMMIIDAHFLGMFKTCATKACRKRKRCTGGPRGTFSRSGMPACMQFENPPEQ